MFLLSQAYPIFPQDYPPLLLGGAPATLKIMVTLRLRLRAMPAMEILQATKIVLILPQNPGFYSQNSLPQNGVQDAAGTGTSAGFSAI